MQAEEMDGLYGSMEHLDMRYTMGNAVEEYRKEPAEKRYLRLSGRQAGNFYILEIENCFSGALTQETGEEFNGNQVREGSFCVLCYRNDAIRDRLLIKEAPTADNYSRDCSIC